MATNKTGTTLASLTAKIAVLQAQADSLRQKEVREIIAKVKDAISHYGLTAADLGFGEALSTARRTAKVAGTSAVEKGRRAAAGKKAAKVVKFKDDQGNTWGGMGKRPAWFKAALAAGKKPEDLLVKG